MRRRFLRPFVDLTDDFFFPTMFDFNQPLRVNFKMPKHRLDKQLAQAKKHRIDPEKVFDNFFSQNQIKQQEEKDFFKKFYPEKVQEIDPYKVLQISKDANEEQINQAYRKLAIKYHPKNNDKPEAKAKFAEIARAYQQALQAKNQAKYSDLGIQSFFDDFDKKLDQMVESVTGDSKKALESNKQVKQGQQTKKKDQQQFGQLYSQSSYVENVDGKQTKFLAQKKFKKDDKTLSVKRQQTLKEDGKTEILETIDDGKQVKKKHYILDKDKKQRKQLE